MELRKVESNEFIQDMASLNEEVKKSVVSKIDAYSFSLMNGRELFDMESDRPYLFNLKYGSDSTLYSLKVDPDHKLIATVDEDPIFDQLIFTLFAIARDSETFKRYKQIGLELYGNEGMLEGD